MSFKRHNKKRNAALLYEFLIRHISKCLLSNKKQGAGNALDISKRYFSNGSLLYGELFLFKNILNTRVKSRHSAQKIINDVCDTASKMNSRKLDVEKSKLIKEINHTLKEKTFYNYKIPNYTVYASVQTLLNEIRNKKKSISSVEKIKLEDNIVEYLINDNNNNKNTVQETLKVNPNYNNAVYKFTIERFHKKYDQKLNESQKKLITKWVVYNLSGKTGVLKSALQKESKIIKEKLMKVHDDEIRKDKDLMKKLNECYHKFSSIDFDEITEQKVFDVLQFMKLIEEVEQ